MCKSQSPSNPPNPPTKYANVQRPKDDKFVLVKQCTQVGHRHAYGEQNDYA